MELGILLPLLETSTFSFSQPVRLRLGGFDVVAQVGVRERMLVQGTLGDTIVTAPVETFRVES